MIRRVGYHMPWSAFYACFTVFSILYIIAIFSYLVAKKRVYCRAFARGYRATGSLRSIRWRLPVPSAGSTPSSTYLLNDSALDHLVSFKSWTLFIAPAPSKVERIDWSVPNPSTDSKVTSVSFFRPIKRLCYSSNQNTWLFSTTQSIVAVASILFGSQWALVPDKGFSCLAKIDLFFQYICLILIGWFTSL